MQKRQLFSVPVVVVNWRHIPTRQRHLPLTVTLYITSIIPAVLHHHLLCQAELIKFVLILHRLLAIMSFILSSEGNAFYLIWQHFVACVCVYIFSQTENWKWTMLIFLPKNLPTPYLPYFGTQLSAHLSSALSGYQKFLSVMTEISISFTVRSHSHFLQT